MITPWTARRTPILIALFLAACVAPFLAWQGAQGGERRPPSTLAPHGIVVVGDSITARYNDTPGDPKQEIGSASCRARV